MADIYKISTIIIILNLGLSLLSATIREGDTWENFYEGNWIQSTFNRGETTGATLSEKDTITSPQTTTTIEDTGGVSKAVVVAVGGFILIGKVAIGGLAEAARVAFYPTGGDTLLRMIALFSALFLVIMQLFVGLKMYSWFINKDTR